MNNVCQNILQDINGRSTTPLGAEQLTAEETVLLYNKSSFIMRKLKRLYLLDVKVLSNLDLASIAGGLDIHAEDYCHSGNIGKTCVYSFSSSGDSQTFEFGTCRVHYVQNGTIIETYFSCDK